MENATKALLIAAGILLAIMILSLLLVGYNQISSYYNEKHKATETEQLAEFNQKYENYNGKEIRGSELVSLMNKVIDYNERESYFAGTNYPRIEVTITIGANNLDQFKYDISKTEKAKYDSILPATGIIQNTGTGTSASALDRQLIAITSTPDDLIYYANTKGINGVTDSKLQQLSSNIGNIMVQESNKSDYDNAQRVKRVQLINKILGLDIELKDKITGEVSTDNQNKIEVIKEITCKYYQYTQFKRAHFKCTSIEYDKNTGRINKMTFEVVTTSGGNVKFN